MLGSRVGWRVPSLNVSEARVASVVVVNVISGPVVVPPGPVAFTR